MRLTIVRHGETPDNKKRICQGQLPGRLTIKGWMQAGKVAKRLKDSHFDVVYSSDLRRAVQTAKRILRYHKKVPVYYVPALRERTFGEFEGKRWKDISVEWEEEKKKRGDPGWIPEGGESRNESEKRFLRFFKKMEKEHFGQNILWVTHGGGVRAVLKILEDRTGKDHSTGKPPNTSVTILEIDEDKQHHVHLVNCVKHL